MGFSLPHLTICLFMKSETSKLQVYYISALKTYFCYIISIYINELIQNEIQRNTSPIKYANIQTITII